MAERTINDAKGKAARIAAQMRILCHVRDTHIDDDEWMLEHNHENNEKLFSLKEEYIALTGDDPTELFGEISI